MRIKISSGRESISMRIAAPAIAVGLLLFAGPTRAAMPEAAAGGWAVLQARAAALQDWMDKAIVAGAVVIYRNRHTLAGTGLGCAAGAALGAGSAVAAGAATGGAAFAGTPQAMALGCGLGAAAGAALGYPMDHLFE